MCPMYKVPGVAGAANENNICLEDFSNPSNGKNFDYMDASYDMTSALQDTSRQYIVN